MTDAPNEEDHPPSGVRPRGSRTASQVAILKGNKQKEKAIVLNYLRNDFDLYHRKVIALMDKKQPTSDEVFALGKEVVNKLLIRKVLKKEHLLDIHSEIATSPKRSCSAGGRSPRAQTTQGSEKRSKSQTRCSRRDQNDDVKTRFDFDEESQSPAVTRGVNEDLYIENAELKKEITRLTEQLELSHGSIDRDRSGLTDTYRSERNETREQYDKLVEDYKRMKDRYERKIVCQQYEQQKLGEKIQRLQSDAAGEKHQKFQNLLVDAEYLRKELKETDDRLEKTKEALKETDESLKTMTEAAESYKRTNDNQTKYILELQTRIVMRDGKVKDANVAIEHHKEEIEKYREFSDQVKSEIHELKMEKEVLLGKIQKLRADAKDKSNKHESEVVTLKTKIQTLKTEREEKDEAIIELNSVRTSVKKANDQQDLKRHEQDSIRQKKEKEALEDQLAEMENRCATLTKEHIESEQKLKHDMIHYRNERNRLQTKVESLDTEVSDLTSKFKEQQVLFTLEKEKLETDIERLEKHLHDVEHVQIQDFSTRASDYQKEEMDRKNEELVRLKRKLYHVEEDLKSYKEQVVLLETKDNEQREIITRFAQQLKSSEDRTNAAKRLSDNEKENASLKRELTEAVQSVEEKKDYKDRYDRDCNRLRKDIERLKKLEKEKDDLQKDNNRLNDQINQLQVQWDKLKSEREQEKAIAEEVMKLKEQKFRLENDKHIMRQEILSLQEKVKSADEFRHSNEVLRSEVESLKASIRGLQSDNRLQEDKCKSETTARITRDDLSSRYKEDCERLRKERNTAQHDLLKISREKEGLVNRLRTEFESLKLDVDKTKNKKAELGVLYKAQLKKGEEKVKRLEKQNEILQERTSSTETSDQHQAYELLQLKNDYDICKVQKKQLEEEISDLKQEVADLENKQVSTRDRQCEQCPVLQREIENLTKRLNKQVERNSIEDILSRKVQELKADNRILEQKLGEVERRKCKLCDELSHKLSKAETEVKEATRRLQKEEKRTCLKCDDYERKLSQAKQDYQELQDKLQETKETFRETVVNLQTMSEAAETYKRTNENQQQYILELQNRNRSHDDEVVKDANAAIVHYKEETGKYRKFCDKAKSENLKLKMENYELLTKIRKLKADAKEDSNKHESEVLTLRTKIRVLETDREEKDKVIENQTTEIKSVKDMLTKAKKNLDQQDMKRYEKDFMKQKHEIEALKDQLMKMENQYATQTEEHIESEQKLKHEMNRYRNERNRLQTKVESLGTEVSDLTSKLKEQQVLFTLEKEKLESDIERLEKHLYDLEHVQIQDFSTRSAEYQKIEMDNKNEELVRLTRKMYLVEEDLKSYKEQVVVLETKDNEQRDIIRRLSQQLKSSEDRVSANAEDSNTSTLCDPKRPSRLCETFLDIFHGSWYDAYEHLKKTEDELVVIKYLLDVVQNSYKFGEGVFNQYLEALNEALVGPCHDKKISNEIQVMNFNYAKRVAKLVQDDIVELYMSKPEYKSAHQVIQKFVAEVVAICWRFLAHDPPLKLLIDPDTRLFNTEWFDKYKHKGRSISYVVWPMVYREENDIMIVMEKGIAEAN